MEEDYVMIPGSGTKKIIRDVKKEIETAFLDYSMPVIVARALPDVRDGLKPVHRRILYTMHERGNDPSHAYRKSADTVGAVLGSYHPHGDSSVYDAMVRLAQDFSLRYPLVDGQGNFGSVDGDPPAAYRYTEARMSKMAVEMLTDIDKDTINWDPNFDETKKEPSVLPSRFPNLLVNGSQGIAVGMATNIPPHNLGEDRRLCCLHRGPGHRPAGPDGAHQGTGLPHGGHHHGPQRHPRSLRHRPGQDHPAGPGQHRADQERPHPDHHYRDPLYGQQGPPDREHGGPGEG